MCGRCRNTPRPVDTGLLIAGIGLIWLAVVNGLTWLAFAYDKAAAARGDWRIPERQLLMLALAGGTPAAFLARQALRHKTRKQPFSGQLHAVAGVQIVVVTALIVPAVREWIVELAVTAFG